MRGMQLVVVVVVVVVVMMMAVTVVMRVCGMSIAMTVTVIMMMVRMVVCTWTKAVLDTIVFVTLSIEAHRQLSRSLCCAQHFTRHQPPPGSDARCQLLPHPFGHFETVVIRRIRAQKHAH